MTPVFKIRSFSSIFFYVAVFLNGFYILTIEILGARLMGPYFGATVFVWSAIITTTLSALAFGYWLGGLLSRKAPPRVFFYACLAGGGIAAALIPSETGLLSVFDAVGYRLGPLLGSMCLFFVPLLLLSAGTTAGVKSRFESGKEAARAAGDIFGISTLGSIAGAFVSGFLIIPFFQIDTILEVLGIILFLLGIMGLVTSGVRRAAWPLVVLPLMILGISPKSEAHVIFKKQTFYGEIAVRDIEGLGRCLFVDRVLQGCKSSSGKSIFQVSDKLVAPLRLMRKEPNVLFLGLGAGMSADLIDPSTKSTVVEIDPVIAEVAEKFFQFREDETHKVVINDARMFLKRNIERYDLIIIDLYRGASSDPFLWTQEMFSLVKNSLKDGGVMSMNVPGRLSPKDAVISNALTTVGSVFPTVVVNSSHPQNLDNVIVYASDRGSLSFLGVSSKGDGQVLTDTQNGIEHMFARTSVELMRTSKQLIQSQGVVGY